MANLTEISAGSAPDHSAKSKLLRAKGFLWMASSSSLGYYLSQAGQYIEMQVLGNWWADIPKADWPTDEAAVREIMADFDGPNGDRRQELIFIGQVAEGSDARRELTHSLDACLLTDAEMSQYDQIVSKHRGDDELRREFVE
jgi:G3E family GTPase